MPTQKILIVDDSKTIRSQIKDMLPVGNFEVLEAQDGVEALDMIIQRLPNLILLDFFMPRMNGWEVVQKIQSHHKLKNIPVVMMSGRQEDVQKTVPELFEYFEFLSKPFTDTVLFKAIQTANSKARQRQKQVQPAAHVISSPTIDPALSNHQGLTAAENHRLDPLQREIQQMRLQNAELKAEVELLKKQLRQVVLLIRQKLK